MRRLWPCPGAWLSEEDGPREEPQMLSLAALNSDDAALSDLLLIATALQILLQLAVLAPLPRGSSLPLLLWGPS